MRESLALMNPCEDELDAELQEQLAPRSDAGQWGRGLPQPPRPGQWQPYLHPGKEPVENLEELRNHLGLVKRRAQDMTLEQITEGVRRHLSEKYSELPLVTDRFWSQPQAESIAAALAADCGLAPQRAGGLEECVAPNAWSLIPWRTPTWLRLGSRWGIAALRVVFLDALSWQSRRVETPWGLMHVYDTGPGSLEDQPPMILQHGMFVTGWSMALLAWLLARRGRRVIVPDLFDFDHGLSASFEACKGTGKVRRINASLGALLCVAKELLREGATEIDLAGHSFGGLLVTLLASRCERDGIRVRRLVLLGPGGPFDTINPTPVLARIMNDPWPTLEALTPWWIPMVVPRLVARTIMGLLLNANNCNLLLGLRFSEYLGAKGLGSKVPTLLLWGDKDVIAAPRKPQHLGPFLRARFPRLDALWVRGGAHNIQLDSAVALARAMDGWLGEPAAAVDADGGSGHAAASRAGRRGWVEAALLPTDTKVYPMDFPSATAASTALEAGARTTPRARL